MNRLLQGAALGLGVVGCGGAQVKPPAPVVRVDAKSLDENITTATEAAAAVKQELRDALNQLKAAQATLKGVCGKADAAGFQIGDVCENIRNLSSEAVKVEASRGKVDASRVIVAVPEWNISKTQDGQISPESINNFAIATSNYTGSVTTDGPNLVFKYMIDGEEVRSLVRWPGFGRYKVVLKADGVVMTSFEE